MDLNIDMLELLNKYNVQIKRNYPGKGYCLVQCPFCMGENAMSVTYSDKSLFNCFKCGEKGNAISFIAKMENISNKEAYIKEINKDMANRTVFASTPVPKKALDYSHIDKVYRALLKQLTLNKRHKENLLKRGLDEETIRENGYKSLIPYKQKDKRQYIIKKIQGYFRNGDVFEGVPGFYKIDGKWDFMACDGFLVPLINDKNQLYAFQVRLNKAFSDGRKYIYFSSSKHEGSPSVYGGIHVRKFKGSETYLLTEGALKGDVASFLSGSNVITIQGIGASHDDVVEYLIANNLKKIKFAPDMDLTSNERVRNATVTLYKKLKDKGIQVEILSWASLYLQEGDTVKGIDDYLLFLKKRRDEN